LVKPDTSIGETLPVAVIPLGLEVTVYPAMAAPPLLAGAVNATDAVALPALAVAAVGAPGSPAGVTAADGAEAGPGPTLLNAVTVKVYGVPFASPEITIGEPAPDAAKPPGLETTV